ncbi:MAG TPA: cysteine hydrolase [Dehalococcoidia bacterium]|nr:cysteine hydrolase [Dehalococcoidia bacterium]
METKNEVVITIDPAKTALLMLHWQKDTADPASRISGYLPQRLKAAHIIENTQAVLKASREKGIPVIYVNANHRPGYPEVGPRPYPLANHLAGAGVLVRGSWGAEVIESLRPVAGDIIVDNYSSSGFCYTDLDLILHNKGVTDIVLSGIATNWAVESTARDGANRGYFVYTLKDCCASLTDEMHNWTLTNILPSLGAVLSAEEYIAALS